MTLVTPNSNQTVNVNKLLKVNDVASKLNISRAFAYRLLETRQIPSVRIGTAVRVRIQDLEAYIEANRVSNP
jgi:excisionase family DNA binding protein